MTEKDAAAVLRLLKEMLAEGYMREWSVTDGINRHKDGLNFAEWVSRKYGWDAVEALGIAAK